MEEKEITELEENFMSGLAGYLPILVIIAIIVIIVMIVKKGKEDSEDLVYTDDGEFRQKKINKIVRVSLPGGLIGALGVNPRYALEHVIVKHNAAGWNCHQIIPHTTRNLFIILLQVLVLIMTIGLWTFGAGYLLLFEMDSSNYSKKEKNEADEEK